MQTGVSSRRAEGGAVQISITGSVVLAYHRAEVRDALERYLRDQLSGSGKQDAWLTKRFGIVDDV
jgi:hypothetical protein